MEKAIWIIALCEVIRTVQQMIKERYDSNAMQDWNIISGIALAVVGILLLKNVFA